MKRFFHQFVTPSIFTALFLVLIGNIHAAPSVTNVQASQRADGSRLVDIYYDVSDPDSEKLLITVMISDNDGASYDITPSTLSGDIGVVETGTGKHIIWDAGNDLPGVFGANYRAAVTAEDDVPEAGETITINLNLPAGAKPLEMVLIPADTFMMGSPSNERSRDSDETQHQVTLTQGFYMGKFEVTQAQWQAVLGNNPSNFSGKPNNPVEHVSWNQCQQFLTAINDMGLSEYTFRLPTEAEWEYACRAGTTTRFSHGDVLNCDDSCGSCADNNQYMWWCGNNSPSGTKEAGLKLPNPWGLYDMHGNVWEWCQDRYGTYPSGSVVDPIGQQSGSSRVLRGGSWLLNAWTCRSAYRDRYYPDFRHYSLGFRIVLSRTQ